MRRLQVYHEVPVSYLDKSGLKPRYANKGDAAIPFIRARLDAQQAKRVSELTLGRREQHFCGNAATGKPRVHAQPMHDW